MSSPDAVSDVLRLRPDASARVDADRRLILACGARRLALGPLDPAVLPALRVLAGEGGDGDALRRLAGARGPVPDQLDELLTRLGRRGWLQRTLRSGGVDWVTLRPIAHWTLEGPGVPAVASGVRLSRFALLRRDGDHLVLESPLTPAVAVLHDGRAAALVAGLATATAPPDDEPSRAVLALLFGAGFLISVGAGGDDEQTERRLAQWSLPDLLFHARSRQGRHANGYGATYPLASRFEALPVEAQREEPADRAVELHRPDLAAAAAADPPLTTVLESRQSVREHDDERPLTARQLGEFLFRCAGVRPGVTRFADGSEREHGTARPYPSGGALYELEVWPVVRLCAGLDPGLYRYDPFAHRLVPRSVPADDVDRLVEDGRRKSVMVASPQVLLVVTARFGRVMFKYESIAYAVILKNVGVLLQTMYCVATAMGLAPCALGGGDADGFARLAGLDYYEESSVGELLLGSQPPRES